MGGHVTPMCAVGAALVARGHQVRVLTGARFRAEVEGSGMTFVAWPAPADYDDRDLNGSFPGRAHLRGVKAVRFDMSNLFARPMGDQFAAISAALEREAVGAIVCELTITGLIPMLVGNAPRPPIHVLGCTPLPVTGRDTFPYGLGLEPPATPAAKLRARVMTVMAKKVILSGVQRELDAQLRGRALAGMPVFFTDWFVLADRFWQLSVEGFEYPRSDLADNVRFAGPLLGHVRGEAPGWWDDLDGSRPVVHVTQGTVDNHDFSKLIGPTLMGLADHDVVTVVTTGGRALNALPSPLPDNVRCATFIPYHLLLPKVDVMVTNGGYGGVQYAITHGVPLVVAPEREDKPDVAARVAWSGIGLNLKTGRPTADTVARAVTRVLGDPSYRGAARRLASEARGYDALASIVAELESTGAPPRRPQRKEQQ